MTTVCWFAQSSFFSVPSFRVGGRPARGASVGVSAMKRRKEQLAAADSGGDWRSCFERQTFVDVVGHGDTLIVRCVDLRRSRLCVSPSPTPALFHCVVVGRVSSLGLAIAEVLHLHGGQV